MGMNSEELASASVAFDLVARLVQCEPDETWITQCVKVDAFSESPFGGDDPAVRGGLELLSSWCSNVQDPCIAANEAARDWLRLFAGAGAPEAPIVESVYTEPNSTMFGRSTIAVHREYARWGLEFERSGKEPDDALGLMLAFCAHLMREQVRGIQENDAASAGAAATALEQFLAQHMLPWVSAWRFLVNEHAKTDYYRGVGDLVFGLERALAARFGIAFNESDGTFAYRAD